MKRHPHRLGLQLRAGIADADAEDEPPAAERVDVGGQARREDGMAVGQHADRRAELHAPRPPGQPGEGGEGIVKRLGVTLAHVRRHGHVIGNHDGVVAEVLGEARPPAERVRARSGPEVEDIHADFHGRAPRDARGTMSASTATQPFPRGTTVIGFTSSSVASDPETIRLRWPGGCGVLW